MKQLFSIFLFLFFTSNLFSQFVEDFSDGEYTSNPTWLGDDSVWIVNNGVLQSNSFAINKSFYLATASAQIQNTQWQFTVKLDFNTSSTNYVDVYLASDTSNLLSAARQGYFVRMGSTQDDICLYKRIGSTETKLIDGTDGFLNTSSNNFALKVIQKNSVWKIYLKDIKSGATAFNFLDSATDNSFNNSKYFGIAIKQSTSSFFAKHFFDDFYVGAIISDTTAPVIDSFAIVGNKAIDFYFNENIKTPLVNANMYLNGNGAATNMAVDLNYPNVIHCIFPQNIGEGNFSLDYYGMSDEADNITDQSTFYFSQHFSHLGNILINEVFSDYNPSVGLPDYKFIELYNTSDNDFNLLNWYIKEDSKTAILPNISIPKKSYLIVTSSYAASLAFQAYGPTIYVSNFPSLNTTGSEIVLYNDRGTFIHQFRFDKESYRNAVKSEGGWSLEWIDPYYACDFTNNISASTNSIGGTPGTQNSLPSSEFIKSNFDINAVKILSDTSILVVLNHSISSDELTNSQITINDNLVNSTHFYNQIPNLLLCDFSSPLVEKNTYTLKIDNIKSCTESNTTSLKYQFGKPSKIDSFDLVINEILPNVSSYMHEYVELYNNTDKIFHSSQIVLAKKNEFGVIDETHFVNGDTYIFPQQYYVLTQDKSDIVQQHYTVLNPKHIITLESSFSLSNDGDYVVIANLAGQVIDQVNYTSKWQYPLLNSDQGVSLERMTFGGLSQDQNNWHSASFDKGYGTPTYVNSSFIDQVNNNDLFSISQNILSPNGDGKDDYIVINYKLQSAGNTLNATLYDMQGRMESEIYKNKTIATEGNIVWDGINRYGEMTKAGNYILYLETYNLTGKKEIKKFSVNIAD